MPRLKPTPQQDRETTFNALVRYYAEKLGLRTETQIGEFLGLEPQTYRYRMRNKSAWSYPELVRMFKKLRFSDADIGRAFKE